jgi:hypothetical protein
LARGEGLIVHPGLFERTFGARIYKFDNYHIDNKLFSVRFSFQMVIGPTTRKSVPAGWEESQVKKLRNLCGFGAQAEGPPNGAPKGWDPSGVREVCLNIRLKSC